MRVVLASESKTKIEAVQKAFTDTSMELVTVNVLSGINEQPMNDETLTGAFNRLKAAMKKEPDADIYIAIENGIFKEFGDYVDRAIVLIQTRDGVDPDNFVSEGVMFPREAVKEAQRRGLDKITVGKVMAEKGIVKDHADPHKDLRAKSRSVILAETLAKAVKSLREDGVFAGPSPL